MIEIVLLRHSITAGNLEGRYIGSRTDEPLCPDGIALLENFVYPFVERIYVSPMKRCIQTAGLIWPEMSGHLQLVPGLRECDFGIFENRNYQELSSNPDYQAWIDSEGTLPFPGGEDPRNFKIRCQEAFAEIVASERKRETEASELQKRIRIGIVAHGGTIMAIMERYGEPGRSYYDYQVKNGKGYLLTPADQDGRWNYRPVESAGL